MGGHWAGSPEIKTVLAEASLQHLSPWHLRPYGPSHAAGSPGRLGWPPPPLHSCSQVPAQAMTPNARYCPATSWDSGPWLRCGHHPSAHLPVWQVLFCLVPFSIPVSRQPESEVLAHDPKQRQKRLLVKRVFCIKENLSLKFLRVSLSSTFTETENGPWGWSASWRLGCCGSKSGS